MVECFQAALESDKCAHGLGVLVPTLEMPTSSLIKAYNLYTGYIQALVPPERLLEIDIFECTCSSQAGVMLLERDGDDQTKCSMRSIGKHVLGFLENLGGVVNESSGFVNFPPRDTHPSHAHFKQCVNDDASYDNSLRYLPIEFDGQWRKTDRYLNKTCFRENGKHKCPVPRSEVIYEPLINVNFSMISEFLIKKRIRVYMVGDSLMEQQMDALRCEFADVWTRSQYYHSPFLLAPTHKLLPNPLFYMPDAYEAKCHWYDTVPEGTTHVVLNSGLWWTSDTPDKKRNKIRFINSTQSGIQDGFRDMMQRLGVHIKHLTSRGIKVFWRDTSPYGRCTGDLRTELDRYTGDYVHIPDMNDIARNVFLKNGGHVLPIYKLSAMMWQEHFDGAHYCMENAHSSIPSVWNRLMLLSFWKLTG